MYYPVQWRLGVSKIAAIQMCSSHLVDENLKIAQQLISEAAGNHANLIVMPEMFAMMGRLATDKLHIKETLGQGMIQSFLSEQARNNRVWIVGGTIPIACDHHSKIRAASLVYDDKGNLVAHYDKIHLFDATLSENEKYSESETTEAGNKITIVDTPFGRLGLAVCYDIRFPELFRCLFDRGAEIIALPSAFTVPTGKAHWEVLVRSRAIENFCYVIGAAQGGTHTNGRETYGHSMIVEPWGGIAAKLPGMGEGIIYTDINLRNVYEGRKLIPVQNHRRILIDTSVIQWIEER